MKKQTQKDEFDGDSSLPNRPPEMTHMWMSDWGVGLEQNSIPQDLMYARQKELLAQLRGVLTDIQQESPELYERVHRMVLEVFDPNARWRRIEVRMEGLAKEHPDWTPSRLAETVRYYVKFDQKMLNCLRRMARRIKRRVYMRKVRKQLACLDEPMP